MIATEKIQSVVSRYFTGRPVKRAYLFGSRARGEATDTSDVDILVEYDRERGRVSLFDHIGMQLDLEESLCVKVDLVSANGLSPRIARYIHADKQLIYASAA